MSDLLWEFYRDASGEHRWRARDEENKQILFVSAEGYARKIDSVKCAARAGFDHGAPHVVDED